MELFSSLFPYFFVFVGLLLIIISISIRKKVNNMIVRCNKKVTAKISKREISSMEDSTLSYFWYEYNIDGKKYNTRAKYMISALKYKVGDEVEILYNPNDPNDFYNPNGTGKKSPTILLIMGISFLILGIIAVILTLTF